MYPADNAKEAWIGKPFKANILQQLKEKCWCSVRVAANTPWLGDSPKAKALMFSLPQAMPVRLKWE